MELTIIGPTHKKTLSIAWFEIESTVGNFVIQPGHAPMLVILAPRTTATVCLINGKQETLPIPGGIAKIDRKGALLIVDE